MHVMRVALFNLEPKVENTAMMQVSQYHKQRGDQVEVYSALYHQEYDKIYCFSIFQFTSKARATSDMICGGTGFNLKTRLPPEIEVCNLDYSIFPRCKTSYLWFSRGCIRTCGFCYVPTKEGTIHPVTPKNLNPKGEYVSIMDNNFFASPAWQIAIDYLVKLDQPVNFHQGIDARIFDDEQGRALQKLTIWKQLYVAMDNPDEQELILGKIKWLMKYIPKSKIGCFVLVGWNSTREEDLARVMALFKRGVDPYVMPYNKRDPYQMAFTRWVNRRLISTTPWEKYEHGKWRCTL